MRRLSTTGDRALLRRSVLALVAVWLVLVVGLSLVAARVTGEDDRRRDDCAISLRSSGFDACVGRR